MNLTSIEKLQFQDDDIVIIKCSETNKDQLQVLFSQLQKIKQKSGKKIEFIVLDQDWRKLLQVQITDIKNRMYQIDTLIKQLIRTQEGLCSRLTVQGTADQLTKKVLDNLEYTKQKLGIK